ncbi:MAG: N-acetylmuramoyl-L-alanine amidase [Candidatus Eremiobacteraeota bacterium]|nr:N-acetylmuramoyl-L-alanine amidase [Candidatus Eremiobacteraeota bacterium]MBC5803443.1 N-acetylmuramoyl-L-alanine amidase [Candidatus Eremiobacteraeota bacterium]MBC5821502.1 N-acetylmuramoyl-L-alanine amidase [Candidatus Eremiobacteraeota bacterium]
MTERSRENEIDTYPHWRLEQWEAAAPPGRVDHLYVHWSAHDYQSVFPAYHFCIAGDGDGSIVVVNTHDVRENMRDVAEQPQRPYAAHTRGRNAYALGISIMAMREATPADFGDYPLTEPLVDALCLVTAKLAQAYGVPLDAEHVMSHAEAALHDGYFGTGPDERWDIARLAPDRRPLVPSDATRVGDELRVRMLRFRTS